VDAWQLQNAEFLPAYEKFVDEIKKLANGTTGPVELASEFAKHDFLLLLGWLNIVIWQLLYHMFLVQNYGNTKKFSLAKLGLDKITLGANVAEKLFGLYDKIGQYQKIAREQINEQMAFEELAIALMVILRQATKN